MNVNLRFNLVWRQVRLMGKGSRVLAMLVVGGCMLAATVRELRLPAAERTWNGTLFGLVPYDLRPPTLQRLSAACWNPSNPRILRPTAYGVGWSVNLAALLHHPLSRLTLNA